MTNQIIDSLSFGDHKYVLTLPHGACDTAAGTAAKTVTITNFNLETGAQITVKFTNGNTASTPTLNVNSSGAKAIKYRGTNIKSTSIIANQIYNLLYDGTDWNVIGSLDAETTKYFWSVYIAQGTDLNTVITPGAYYCSSNAIAQSLVNCPTTRAFSLLVLMSVNSSSVTQELTTYLPNEAKTYKRSIYSGSAGAWEEMVTSSGGTFTGGVSTSAYKGTDINATPQFRNIVITSDASTIDLSTLAIGDLIYVTETE